MIIFVYMRTRTWRDYVIARKIERSGNKKCSYTKYHERVYFDNTLVSCDGCFRNPGVVIGYGEKNRWHFYYNVAESAVNVKRVLYHQGSIESSRWWSNEHNAKNSIYLPGFSQIKIIDAISYSGYCNGLKRFDSQIEFDIRNNKKMNIIISISNYNIFPILLPFLSWWLK